MRTEYGAAACPLRSTDRTLTSTASPLLAPRLLAATTNLTAGQGVVGSLAPCSALGANHFVHNMHVRLNLEDCCGKLGVFDLLAARVLHFNSCHNL